MVVLAVLLLVMSIVGIAATVRAVLSDGFSAVPDTPGFDSRNPSAADRP